jgi:hypothetical protein
VTFLTKNKAVKEMVRLQKTKDVKEGQKKKVKMKLKEVKTMRMLKMAGLLEGRDCHVQDAD